VKQSPERDGNGRPIRKSRRQTVDLKVLLADEDDDSDDHSYADNSDDDDDDDDDESDENEKPSNSSKQSRHVIDNSSPYDEDLNDKNVATEVDGKLSDITVSDAEPPNKRRKLEVENEGEKMERQPSEISNGDASDKKSAESISPRSRGRKKVLNHKFDEDSEDVEKWANAIIKYHQQTEDIRTRYVSCCVIKLCLYSNVWYCHPKMTFCPFRYSSVMSYSLSV